DPAYADLAFYYYLQYHLDRHLAGVADYARGRGIVLKGDIPIGIYTYSADAWVEPELYNMDGQAGAPPDAFAAEGQNWGFPTYNWEAMAADGYRWWRQRFTQLGRYFDAFRIDHILGFFRIWETPIEQVEGILGHFNPAIPVSIDELRQRAISFDFDRYCRPYITDDWLAELFGPEADYVKQTFLLPVGGGRWQFREEVSNQRALAAALPADKADLEKKLFRMVSNVLLLPVPGSQATEFHPRISLFDTYSYQQLDGHSQWQLRELHDDYFYRRQEDFWREQGMTKLPAMKDATDMLICGEDLGMVPACVPDVMRDLGILSLEIQRMAKNPKTEFLQPADIPYWAVCSPSTHDMPPIRLWWEEEEPGRRQRFYNQELGWWGDAPDTCSPELAGAIIHQHLHWPAMWTVFPLQDLLAMDGALRRDDPAAERINVPAIVQYYWRYRMHLSLEDLLAADDFNGRLRAMLAQAGRA
ncbi:MAG: 4-alpha-glucanotransferase, partial [Lewinella sp.]|nr:4-alpha-glucanotransferase [Lewinella sp.]